MKTLEDEGSPLFFDGPAGQLEGRLHTPSPKPSLRAVVAHPHPLYGGNMDNSVTRLVAETLVLAGGAVLRFNFRGVGRSQGTHDGGRGEIDDLLAAERLLAELHPRLDAWSAGYSFGASVMLHAARDARLAPSARLLAVAPPLTHYDFDFLRDSSHPLALVCGDCDPLTPGAELQRQSASWPQLVRSEVLARCGHDLGTHSGDYRPLTAALERSISALR